MYRRKFLTTGKRLPTSINTDCFEKNPEFLIEYFSKYIKPMAIKLYEYMECTMAYGPVTHLSKFVE